MAGPEAGHHGHEASQPWVYGAHGLDIASELPLPLRPGRRSSSAVVVRFGNWPSASRCARGTSVVTPAEVKFSVDAGEFRVTRGDRVEIEPSPNADRAVVAQVVLDQALPILLHQRGVLVLHASAVAVGESVVAFTGPSGAGKSTTAAVLCQYGSSPISDDVVAIHFDRAGQPVVFPGTPFVDLWPDSTAYLAGKGPRADAAWETPLRQWKRRWSPEAQATADFGPLPLRALYVLQDDTRSEIRRMSELESLSRLLEQSLAARVLVGPGAVEQHVRAWAALQRVVPARALCRRRRLDALDEIADLVLQDAVRGEQR